jgi:hypothetical protein
MITNEIGTIRESFSGAAICCQEILSFDVLIELPTAFLIMATGSFVPM